MAAGRAAGDRNEVRVTAERADVLLDPRQRPLDVDDVVRPGVQRADAIVQRHADPASVGQAVHQWVGLGAAPPEYPCTARDLHHHRRFPVARQVNPAPDVGKVSPNAG